METATRTPTHETAIDRTEAGLFLAVGFAVWAVATVVVRAFGAALLSPETPLVTAGLFVGMFPAMALLAMAAFRVRGVVGVDRVLAATLLVLPGMVLDSLVVPFFATVFPAVDPSMAGAFGGILLAAYAAVLLTGYLTR
jgi:hypothetical protein